MIPKTTKSTKLSRKAERCLCHDKRVKPHGKKQPRCSVKGHFCSTYRSDAPQTVGMKFSDKVNTVTEKVMAPKIVDRILMGSSEAPIRRSIYTQRYLDLSKEHRTLIHNGTLWDFLWPWSKLNRINREIQMLIQGGVVSLLNGENAMIRWERRRIARKGTLTRADVGRRYRSVKKA